MLALSLCIIYVIPRGLCRLFLSVHGTLIRASVPILRSCALSFHALIGHIRFCANVATFFFRADLAYVLGRFFFDALWCYPFHC
jgi:hypothetical protein